MRQWCQIAGRSSSFDLRQNLRFSFGSFRQHCWKYPNLRSYMVRWTEIKIIEVYVLIWLKRSTNWLIYKTVNLTDRKKERKKERKKFLIVEESTAGLFPSVFNLAESAGIVSNATCGDHSSEVYCKLEISPIPPANQVRHFCCFIINKNDCKFEIKLNFLCKIS